MLSWLRSNSIFLGILLLGFALRFYFIATNGLSNDELSAWVRLDYGSISELIEFGVKQNDMHPFLYHFILWEWVKLFGTSEWALRSLPLSFYVLDAFLIYEIGKRFFNQNTGLFVLIAFSFFGFGLINSTFSRPYVLGTFLILLSFYLLLSIGQNKGMKGQWRKSIMLGLCFSGAILTHYFAVFPVLLMGVSSFIYLKKEQWKFIIIAGIIAALAFLFHWPITSFHLSQGGLGWLDTPSWSWIFQFLFEYFNSSILLLCTVFLMLVWLRWKGKSVFSRSSLLSLIIFCGVIVLGMMVSIYYTPVMREPAMMFVMPFFLFAIFSSVELSWMKNWNQQTMYGVFSIGLILHTLLIFDLSPSKHYADFREQARFIDENRSQDQHQVVMMNNVKYINYYLKGQLNENELDWDDPEVLYNLSTRVSQCKEKELMYVVNYPANTVMHEEIIRRYFSKLKKKQVDNFKSVLLFSKKNDSSNKKDFIRKSSIESSDEFFGELILSKDQLKTDDSLYYIFETELSDTVNKELFWVVVLERENEMLKIQDQPEFYRAFDLSRLHDPNEKSFMAFSLPRELREDERIKTYFWNPSGIHVRTTEIKGYEIKRYH